MIQSYPTSQWIIYSSDAKYFLWCDGSQQCFIKLHPTEYQMSSWEGNNQDPKLIIMRVIFSKPPSS